MINNDTIKWDIKTKIGKATIQVQHSIDNIYLVKINCFDSELHNKIVLFGDHIRYRRREKGNLAVYSEYLPKNRKFPNNGWKYLECGENNICTALNLAFIYKDIIDEIGQNK